MEGQEVRPPRKRRATRGDEKGEVTSVAEGLDVERITAVRSDVAKDYGVSYGQFA